MNMASGTGSHPTRISPRKFSEKIALLNEKERETNEKFEQIIKEVQATRTQQPNLTNANYVLSPKPIDELQCMSNVGHQASHADSLEEIERVYENLMKCVGQYDAKDSETSQKTTNSLTHLDQKFFKHSQHYDYNPSECGLRPSSENSSTNRVVSSTVTTTSRDISAVSYYPQTNNNFQNTNIGVNNNQQLNREIKFIPCEPILKNDFPGHSTLDVCVSSTYLPQVHEDNCIDETQLGIACRARVVSFGSASRRNYSCNNNNPVDQQTSGIRDQCHPYQISHYQTQYLKEPSGDRSRQKSSSDPQLHAAPVSCMLPSENPFKSDNRLAATEQNINFNPNAQVAISCCNYQQRSQIPNYKPNYLCNKGESSAIESKPSRNSNQVHDQPNRILQLSSSSNVDCPRNEVSTTSQYNQQHYNLCDTTNTRNELPGIKICAIEDEHSPQRAIIGDDDSREINCTGHSPLETSLPDISNLQFGTNSASASPERDIYQKQWTQENNCAPVKPTNADGLINTSEAVTDSCQALDSSCASYGCSKNESLAMDVSANTNQQQFDQARQNFLLWHTNGQQQQYSQFTSNTGHNISNSDCGFNISNTHNQQGNLMICKSSELYNSIFRSRSHSSIDHLTKQDNTKRPQLCPDDMQQFEQHHTSQYCLGSDQPVMNVRRIEELKAQGTSTSPLSSSSNLNSPQSEINSPGSSTAEQCDSAMVFPNAAHQDYYPTKTMTGGSCSTLVADETRLLHYKSNEAIEYQRKQQETTNPSAGMAIAQTLNQESYTQNSQSSDKLASQPCQALTTPCSQGFYRSTISRAANTAANSNVGHQ